MKKELLRLKLAALIGLTTLSVGDPVYACGNDEEIEPVCGEEMPMIKEGYIYYPGEKEYHIVKEIEDISTINNIVNNYYDNLSTLKISYLNRSYHELLVTGTATDYSKEIAVIDSELGVVTSYIIGAPIEPPMPTVGEPPLPPVDMLSGNQCLPPIEEEIETRCPGVKTLSK